MNDATRTTIAKMFELRCPLCGGIVAKHAPGDFPLIGVKCHACRVVVVACKTGDRITVALEVKNSRRRCQTVLLDNPETNR